MMEFLEDDELELVTDSDTGEQENDGQLYEHFRMEVDKGQVSVRIDKYIAEHQPHSVVIVFRKQPMLVLSM